MIDLTIHDEQLKQSIERARERHIIIPTHKQMRQPELIPSKIKDQLKNIGLWDINSYNLFRITWKNEPKAWGGLYNGVNYIELPQEVTGVEARIIALVGRWFPTGSHKVGATFGCLVPRLVTGQFNPTRQKAVWPSTGNFCRGGAYNSTLLGCESIAILPEEMSKERFDWLSTVAGEVIATQGCESNVKEIYDKCWELRKTREDIVIFNQFEEFGNYLWHYHVTGHAMEEVLLRNMGPDAQMAGVVLATGSAGTLACGDYLKQKFPSCKIAAMEALQCPTMLLNGFGGHRIEGIGDKHIPWIHNVRNTDMIIAVDDERCLHLIRLFNEPAGQEYLLKQSVSEQSVGALPLLGISSVGNIVAAIQFAKYYELGRHDIVMTIFTDSMELYQSRLRELREMHGTYTRTHAIEDLHRHLRAISTDNMLELSHYDKKRIHHLKYYTWIEQQGRTVEELNRQWYDYPDYWHAIQSKADDIDRLIDDFNRATGLLEAIG